MGLILLLAGCVGPTGTNAHLSVTWDIGVDHIDFQVPDNSPVSTHIQLKWER